MDAATIKKMGKTAIINGSSYDVVPAEQLEEMGPLSGTGTSLVVFSELYQPRRNDSVDYDGKNLTVTSQKISATGARHFRGEGYEFPSLSLSEFDTGGTRGY